MFLFFIYYFFASNNLVPLNIDLKNVDVFCFLDLSPYLYLVHEYKLGLTDEQAG